MAQNLRNRLKLNVTNEDNTSQLNSSPVKPLLNDDTDYSPVYLACTQESLDNVDVLWDWNSPQSKPRTNRRPKRLINHQKSSPRLPVKKHPNNADSYKTFEKIRDELLAFQEDIDAAPFIGLDEAELDFDCSLNNNKPPHSNLDTNNINNAHKNELNDFFDDSLEQELLMVSQQVEEKLKKGEANAHFEPLALSALKTPAKCEQAKKESPRTLTKSFSSNTLFDSPLRAPNRSGFDFKGKLQQLKMEDSFDVALEAFDEFDAVCMAPALGTREKQETNGAGSSAFASFAAGSATTTAISRTANDCSAGQKNGARESPLRFKTKSLSFGHSYVKKSNEEVMREEIEKKRLAALARLRAKKVALSTVLSDSDTSPIKCSPEEIENKRRQALARLEQKKQQELIERNRLEALKKLEMRRKTRRP